ncbi:MAG: aminotransferase class V-fold PLP-dependent enzyme [Acidimicrobiales bacterium]
MAQSALNAQPAQSRALFDAKRLKEDFPLFKNNSPTLAFLDSAASSQRPQSVLDAMDRYYSTTHANVHRGVYRLAEDATAAYEHAREHLGQFLGAPDPSREIVFTKNATEAFNLFIQGLGRVRLGPGRTVLLTEMEHHANLVPWMILQQQLGFAIRYIPVDGAGYLDLADLDRLLEGVSIVGVTLASNVLGTLNPVKEIAARAHEAGALVVGDGAQYAPHIATDVKEVGIDALCITAHKMLGPTGIGALWAKRAILEEMTPFLGGGEMIADVRLDGFTPNEIPHKFEAGTPPIAEAVGLDAALTYLESVGLDRIRQHEIELTSYALARLEDRFAGRIEIFGPKNAAHKGGVISFSFGDIHPHDVAQILDEAGVCVRAGHHCAKPLMRKLGVAATARASFYLYNTEEDVDRLVEALSRTESFFS